MSVRPTHPERRERYDSRQRAVIDACAVQFAERGYHATSMNDLMAATGLTRGGLYHYIESKEGALVKVCDELLEPLLERARALIATDDSPEAHLRAVTAVWLEHVEQHLPHMIVFQRERNIVAQDPRWEDVRRQRAEFEAILVGIFERGTQTGDFEIADPALTTLAFLSMVNYTPMWMRPGGRLRAAQIASGFCDVLLNGIRRGVQAH